MPNNHKQSSGASFLITVAAFVIVVAGMRAAEAILVPFLIAVFVAVICMPSLFWLQKKSIPKALSMLIIIGGIAIVGMLMTTLIGTSLDDFSRDLPDYQAKLQEKSYVLISWFREKGIGIPDHWIRDAFDPGAAMNLAAGLLSKLGNVFTNAFLILLTVIFILLEASSVSVKLHVISDNAETSDIHFDKFIKNINRYMAIKTFTSLGTGVTVSIWLAVLGVDYPLLWGVLAFLLNFVPSIGSIIAAVPAILLALIQLGSGTALMAGLGYLVVNIVIGSIIEPRIMGRGLGLSTLVVFLSLVFWGWVLGPVGMLLSVPLTMTLKIALDSREDTQWIGVLLGSESSIDNALKATSDTADQEKSSPNDVS
jgi:predicted PurR-regulated permease PerM